MIQKMGDRASTNLLLPVTVSELHSSSLWPLLRFPSGLLLAKKPAQTLSVRHWGCEVSCDTSTLVFCFWESRSERHGWSMNTIGKATREVEWGTSVASSDISPFFVIHLEHNTGEDVHFNGSEPAEISHQICGTQWNVAGGESDRDKREKESMGERMVGVVEGLARATWVRRHDAREKQKGKNERVEWGQRERSNLQNKSGYIDTHTHKHT